MAKRRYSSLLFRTRKKRYVPTRIIEYATQTHTLRLTIITMHYVIKTCLCAFNANRPKIYVKMISISKDESSFLF